jgi:hypothetical protein
LVVGISIRWSVDLWVQALTSCFKAVVINVLKLKETLMNILNEIMLFGAALLPSPGLVGAPPA